MRFFLFLYIILLLFFLYDICLFLLLCATMSHIIKYIIYIYNITLHFFIFFILYLYELIWFCILGFK